MDVKLDMVQIFRSVYDHAKKALRVKITDTEINMELNHADGDSVTAHPAKLAVSAIGVDSNDNGNEIIPAMDCSSLRKLSVRIDGTGDVKVLASPTDTGDYFYEISMGETDICARRIKVESIDAIGDVHLVGRS